MGYSMYAIYILKYAIYNFSIDLNSGSLTQVDTLVETNTCIIRANFKNLGS